jgi:trk system potassium uptake protein TrkA
MPPMRVIVVGAGEVGRHIAGTLSADRHEVTVIERDEAAVPALQSDLDALVVAGNGASPRVLEDLGARDADLLLAVTQSDEANLLSAAAGHRMGIRRTLARVRDADYFGGDLGFSSEVLGVDAVIDPEHSTADDLAATLLVPGAAHVEYFAEGRIALAEILVDEGSPLVGRSIGDHDGARPHAVVGLVREGRLRVPPRGERVRIGDRVFVSAASTEVARVVAALAGPEERIDDVVIFGGGRIAFELALRLEERDCHIRILERDAERARFLGERLRHTLILQEEDVTEELLIAHAVGDADAFVACTNDDRTNLLATLHAKRLGTRTCLTVVSREQFVPLVDALGVDGAFSLRLATAEAILRFVRADTVRALYLTLHGAEVLDLHAEEGSPIVGVAAESAGPLEGCEIGAILRDGEVVAPGAQVRFEAGDRVLLFRLPGSAPEAEHAFDG